MEISKAFLISLVERSASVDERRRPPFVTTPLTSASEQLWIEEAQERLAHWRDLLSRRSQAFFPRRLAWDNLDQETVLPLLGPVRWSTEIVPSWADLLGSILKEAQSLRGKPFPQLRFLVDDRPLAFEHVLIPFVISSSAVLKNRAGGKLGLLSSTAQADLERSLLQTLVEASEQTLSADWAVWKSMPEPQPAIDQNRPLYSAYVQAMWGGGLVSLCGSYPVLARVLARISEQWVETTALFLSHLDSDGERLAREFFGGAALGQVLTIGTNLSDRHSGGKTVLEVSFGKQKSCFYKPRDCESEGKFNHLLAWLNRHDSQLDFKTYRVLRYETHAWVEKVAGYPCQSKEEVARFFFRAGMLTAILYALEASDCNCENIIACGEYPVLIDGETLVQPRPNVDDANVWEAVTAATEQMFYDSVLRLHMLPQWTLRADGEKMDISGLGSGRGTRGAFRQKNWVATNTDDMQLRWTVKPTGGRHVRNVTLQGVDVVPEEYMDCLLAGFESMYTKLMEQADQLWAADGPMSLFQSITTRIVVRSTHIYKVLLSKMLEPNSLRDGADVYIALDAACKLFLNADHRPILWPMIAEERACLLDFNIPLFSTQSQTDALILRVGKTIEKYFREPSGKMLRRRFFLMSRKDLDLQKRYIRCSFGYFDPRSVSFEGSNVPAGQSVLGDDFFLEEAKRIAADIEDHAVRASDGSASWITQVYNAEAQVWQVHPIGLFLYDGVCGIALFLAALQKATDSTSYDPLIRATLNVVLKTTSLPLRYHLERESVGAGLGTASLAYCIARIALLRDDKELLGDALSMAARITPKMIANDRRLDLIGGTAGCLLVLRALNAIHSEEWMKELAICCGERLLQAQSVAPNGLRAWKTIRDQHLAGLSHGAAGIGYALAQLYEWTGDTRFYAAALDAQIYETSLFSEQECNWPNLLLPLKEGGYDFWNSWCHGAPGIGLGRLGSMPCCQTDESALDVEHAIAKAGQLELTPLDTVCCGNMGRIELLVEASTRLNNAEYLQRAKIIGSAVVERAKEQGYYSAGVKDGIVVPSFHQGLAGIGYQLLRMANPTAIPSVLTWS